MSEIQRYLQTYDAKLFPLKKSKVGQASSKIPLHKGWIDRDYSVEELENYAKNGHAIGWRLGPTDVVVDADVPTPDRPNKQGHISLPKIEKLIGQEFDGMSARVVSPSGGSHCYLTKPADQKIRKSLKAYPGVDFITEGGFVVIAGSPHWQGGRYDWDDTTKALEIYDRSPATGKLIDLIKRPEVEVNDSGTTVVSPEVLAKMLECLDPTDYREQKQWQDLMVSAHSATGGSREGCQVFVDWSTSDPEFADHGDKIAHRWSTFSASRKDGITIGTLMSELIDHGHDEIVRDVRAAIEFSIEQQEPDKPDEPRQRQRLIYSYNERKLNDKLIKILSDLPQIYQRNGAIIRAHGGLVRLDAAGICEELSDVIELGTINAKQQWEQTRFNERTGRQILGRQYWPEIREIRTFTDIPVFTAQGVLQTPGFDPVSKVYYQPDPDLVVPPVKLDPTKYDAEEAYGILDDLVDEFPFELPEHKSAWFAALFGAIGRPAINGPTPMTFVDGNRRGVGKGLLLHVLARILTGSDMDTSANIPKDDEEMQKVLVSITMRNPQLAMFDNLKTGSALGLPSLDAVLTAGSLSGRILGKSEYRKMDFDTMLFGTGNRARINEQTDIIRRLNYIHLETKEERPEARKGFKHGNDDQLKAKVNAQRGQLIHAALTILQAAHVAELDSLEIPAWGSYDAFSRIARKPLIWLGLADPLDARKSIERFTDTDGELSMILDVLGSITGPENRMTAGEIHEHLSSQSAFAEDEDGEETASYERVLELLCPRHYRNPKQAIGYTLKSKYRDQALGGRWIRHDTDGHRKQLVYWVEDAKA